MSWLPIIICLAALALIVGPVMLMQPTPAQRREASLRKEASSQGLRVHFQPIPEGCDFQSRNNQAVTYCLPWQHQSDIKNQWLLVRKRFAHELHFSEQWDWVQKPKAAVAAQVENALRDVLVDTPDFVFAVASGPQGLCGFWSEMGEVEKVRVIGQWLKASANRLSVH